MMVPSANTIGVPGTSVGADARRAAAAHAGDDDGLLALGEHALVLARVEAPHHVVRAVAHRPRSSACSRSLRRPRLVPSSGTPAVSGELPTRLKNSMYSPCRLTAGVHHQVGAALREAEAEKMEGRAFRPAISTPRRSHAAIAPFGLSLHTKRVRATPGAGSLVREVSTARPGPRRG
jgi:hypothetical protein